MIRARADQEALSQRFLFCTWPDGWAIRFTKWCPLVMERAEMHVSILPALLVFEHIPYKDWDHSGSKGRKNVAHGKEREQFAQ